VVALLGLAAMLWVGEGRRSQVLPVVLAATAGRWCWYLPATGFRRMRSAMFPVAAGFCGFHRSGDAVFLLWRTLDHGSRRCWPGAYLGLSKSRYSEIRPAAVLSGVDSSRDDRRSRHPWLWSLPFLLTFVGGVFADAYEEPKGRLAMLRPGLLCCCRRCFAC